MTVLKLRRTWLGLVAGLLMSACGGGAAVATFHNGYPDGETQPWSKATPLKFNDSWEASASGTASFPEKKRAIWYVVDLPSDGTLSAKLSVDATSPKADIGFEVLDYGFNVRAAEQDSDAGQPKKSRDLTDVRTGKMYFHLWAVNRTDIADYKLRVTYVPTKPGVDPRSGWPYTVPNPPAFASVGEDDSPQKPVAIHHPGHKPPADPVVKPVVDKPDPIDPKAVRGSITEFSATGTGVKITINRGNSANVEEGWEGYIVDHATKHALQNGGFKISKVKNDESEAMVKVPLDAVQANKSVVLKPPK
jgi:hypothetical protein